MSNYTDKFEWSDDIEDILNKIRINCVTLTRYHKEKYYEYIQMQDYVDFDYDDYYIDEI